jgi:hypothetical protein
MRPVEMAWTLLRWLYALFFFATGVAIALHVMFGIGGPPTPPTAADAAFQGALHRSGFIDPLLAVSFLGGGGALALRRTTPLGLVLLAPAVAVIACDDILLANAAPVGVAVLVVWGLLALRVFPGFRGLWTYSEAAKP